MNAEPMQRAHLSGVAELERLCFGEPWSENALSLLLSDVAAGVVVCNGGDRVVAYGGMLFAPDEGQVTNVAVHPDFRRCGLGNTVVEALIARARVQGCTQLSLEVRASNAAAIALYRKHGFEEAGRRKRFYKAPAEDAIVMLWHASDRDAGSGTN